MTNSARTMRVRISELVRRRIPIHILNPGEDGQARMRVDGIVYACEPDVKYPKEVIQIQFRSGAFQSTYVVYSDPVLRRHLSSFGEGDLVSFNTSCSFSSHLAPEDRMTFEQISQLKDGDEVQVELPQSRLSRTEGPYERRPDGWLSDGVRRLSPCWPGRASFYPDCDPTDWPLLLAAAEGRFHSELEREGIAALRARMEILREEARRRPFSRQPNGSVSNGWIIFPQLRPYGADWQYPEHRLIRFARHISQLNWALFLEVIIGMTYDRMLAFEDIRHLLGGTPSPPIDEARPGECADASFFDQLTSAVAFGERFVFSGVTNGRTVHLVDKPEYGVGLYVFAERQDAIDWAEGRLPLLEARRRGQFIAHSEGWRERVRLAMSRVGSAS